LRAIAREVEMRRFTRHDGSGLSWEHRIAGLAQFLGDMCI
jgi:hypothetical protein